jgi:excisionase family DNA binding protein
MEPKQVTRLIDISTDELEIILESSIQKILDKRLPKPDLKYYTVKELEKLLECSRVTIYKLTKEGKLSYRRISTTRKIRFTQEDIDSFMQLNPGFVERRARKRNG